MKHFLVSWGVWPAIVMVLGQLETARIFQTTYPTQLAALTLAGTLTVYGADRWLERITLVNLEARHRRRHVQDLVFFLLIPALLLYAQPFSQLDRAAWLLSLGLLGSAYLLTTVGRLPNLVITKEILGGACFSWLIVGGFQIQTSIPLLLFFGLGLANFLASSYQDRSRDEANRLKSPAVSYPRATRVTASTIALLTAGAAFSQLGITSSLAWAALAHGLFPLNKGYSIDYALTPFLATLVFLF